MFSGSPPTKQVLHPNGRSLVVGGGWFRFGGIKVQLGQWMISFTTVDSLVFELSGEVTVLAGMLRIGNCWMPRRDGSIITLGSIMKLCGWIPIIPLNTISEFEAPLSQPSVRWSQLLWASVEFSSSMGPVPADAELLTVNSYEWCWCGTEALESWDDCWAAMILGRKLPELVERRSKSMREHYPLRLCNQQFLEHAINSIIFIFIIFSNRLKICFSECAAKI